MEMALTVEGQKLNRRQTATKKKSEKEWDKVWGMMIEKLLLFISS